MDNSKRKTPPAQGVVNEIEYILRILRLPNFALPVLDQVEPDPFEQMRVALMNIRKKLDRANKLDKTHKIRESEDV